MMDKLSQATSTQNNTLTVVISTRNTENISLKHLMEIKKYSKKLLNYCNFFIIE